METKQDIEKRELKKEILELRNENKEYEKKLIELLQQEHDGERVLVQEAAIKFYGERISSNDRQIETKELQILELMKKQGKVTALPFFSIFRQLIYPPSLLTFFLVSMISQIGFGSLAPRMSVAKKMVKAGENTDFAK